MPRPFRDTTLLNVTSSTRAPSLDPGEFLLVLRPPYMKAIHSLMIHAHPYVPTTYPGYHSLRDPFRCTSMFHVQDFFCDTLI